MALSANASLSIRNMDAKRRRTYTILTGAVLYKHALVGLTAAGKAKVCANSATLRFAGLCEAECDTGDGTVTVDVLTDLEVLITMQTGFTAGHVLHTKIYAVDDASATVKTTLGPNIGIATEYVSATSGWVQLNASPLVAAS